MVNRTAMSLLGLGIHPREDALNEFHSGCRQAGLLKEFTRNCVFRWLAPLDASARKRPIARFDALPAQTAQKEAIMGVNSQRVGTQICALRTSACAVLHLVSLPTYINSMSSLPQRIRLFFQGRVAGERIRYEAGCGRQR